MKKVKELDPRLKLIALGKDLKTGEYTKDLIPYFIEQNVLINLLTEEVEKLQKDVEKFSHIQNIDMEALGDNRKASKELKSDSKKTKY